LKRARIELDDDGMGVVEIDAAGEKNKLETAKITLNDCLACSGCITSAESVLITQQSKEEFYTNLAAVGQKKTSEGTPILHCAQDARTQHLHRACRVVSCCVIVQGRDR
jgi:iron only hydrogenase large subunit-like protein